MEQAERTKRRPGRPSHEQVIVHDIPFDWEAVDREFNARAEPEFVAQPEKIIPAVTEEEEFEAQPEQDTRRLRLAA